MNHDDWVTLRMVLLLAALVICGVTGAKWYAAGIQRDVYARQGCRMTRWEVFCGAKPIDRNFARPDGGKAGG